MDDAPREHFWRGPIRSERRAVSIVRWAGWTFIGFGVLGSFWILGDLKGADPAQAISSFIESACLVAPGAVLVRFKSRIAAIILFSLTMLTAALFAMILVNAIVGKGMGFAIAVPMGLFWLLLALLTWRAIRATFALHRLGRGDDVVAATFD